MVHKSPIEELEEIKISIEEDIAWYQRPNRPGVFLSDAYRKAQVAELTTLLADYTHIIKLLSDDRFNAIVGDLIRFTVSRRS